VAAPSHVVNSVVHSLRTVLISARRLSRFWGPPQSRFFDLPDGHSGPNHTRAQNRRHVATPADDRILESRVDDVQYIARFSGRFETDQNFAQLKQRSFCKCLHTQPLDRNVFAYRSGLKRKPLGDELLQHLEIEKTECSIRSIVLVVSMLIAANSRNVDFSFHKRTLWDTAGRSANCDDSRNRLGDVLGHDGPCERRSDNLD
jgi:hypothetical protein